MKNGLLAEQDQELPLPRHVVSTLQHIDLIEHPIVVVLMGTEEVVVGDPECHVIVGAIIIVVTAADPISGFKCAVKPFDHLLVGAELLRNRVIVCEPNYLGNVKPEAVPQLPCELLGGQRIGTIPVGNEAELFGEAFHAPESHAHGEDARPDGTVVRNLVAEDGAGCGIHDEPEVAFDAPDLDISLISRKDGGLWIFVVVNKGLNDNGGS